MTSVIEQLPLKKEQMWRISVRNLPHLRDLADVSPATTNRVVEQVYCSERGGYE
jgi:hypothetical protein